MSTASITTDINIGPFKIPSNGQNMIMNNYAQMNNLVIEFVIPEPFQSNALATIQWMYSKNKNIDKIILCSIHQLPVNQKRINELLNNLKDVEFHFVLEGIYGKGKKFLLKRIEEARMFMNVEKIDCVKTTWSELYKMKQEKGTR